MKTSVSTRPWALGAVILVLSSMILGCGFLGGVVELAKKKAGIGVPSGPPIDLRSEVLYVSASTAVQDFKGYTFQPSMLHDGNIATCWQESNKDTPGQGETFTVRFARPVNLTQIRIANGCQNHNAGKYGDLYAVNSRPRSLQLSTPDGGNSPVSWALRDQVGWQILDVSMGDVEELTFRIGDVYRGSKWQDASVSEIMFFGLPTGADPTPPALSSGRYCYRGSGSADNLVGDVRVTGRHAQWMIGESHSDNVVSGQGVVTPTSLLGMSTYMLDMGKFEHTQDRLQISEKRLTARVALNQTPCESLDRL